MTQPLQPEDDNPLEHTGGEPADAPEDAGRPPHPDDDAER